MCVSDKAYKFPLTQVDDLLWYVLRKVDDTYLLVVRCKVLVSEQGILDFPRLRHGFLRICIFLLFFIYGGCEKRESQLVTSMLIEYNRTENFFLLCDQDWWDMPQLPVILSCERLLELEFEMNVIFWDIGALL